MNSFCRLRLPSRFSRRSIIDFIHIIYRHVDTLARRIHEFEERAEPLNLSHAFPALTGDIIMDYFFGFNYDQLKNPDFESFHEAFIKIGDVGHVATQFPMILPVRLSICELPRMHISKGGALWGMVPLVRDIASSTDTTLADYEQHP